MAASSSYTLLVTFLVAFAAITPSLLHQSAAARDGGAAKATAAPAPSANGGGDEAVVHPTATYEIPDLPLPRVLPCPPAFPKIPFIPCYNVTLPPASSSPRPKECLPSLVMMMPPCSGFLTNSSSSAPKDPSKRCCDGVNLFLSGDRPSIYDPLCLCHVVNGDVKQLLSAPLDHARALALVQTCLGINAKTFSNVCNGDKLREQIPPMELPKPPTPAPGSKA